jgi:hypothetical protein
LESTVKITLLRAMVIRFLDRTNPKNAAITRGNLSCEKTLDRESEVIILGPVRKNTLVS